jgi:DNA polymerase-3 subunit gamma/tau
MSYQVFARKYRPQTFAEVVGQEHITRTLANAIAMGRVAQAYLLVGPRGTGKTSTARIIAKALNAPDGPKIDFDPETEICREIAEGRSLDVLEIDGASNNGVEQVRDLRDNVRFAPVKGRFKVYIIDEVHMLSSAAFNALLKTLEEPPAHVKFIFATTEVHKVPATVLSRCQRFDFRRIGERAIAGHLRFICEKEGATADEAALRTIARYADGGLRDAEVALDQVIGFFGNHVAEEGVLQMFGLTGIGPVIDLALAIVANDAAAILRQSRALAASGKDLGKLTQDLLKFFRDFALFQTAPETVEAELTPREREAFVQLAAVLTPRGTLALLEELSLLESRLRYALSKEVIFEVALLQLAQLRERVSLETLLHHLGGGAPAAPAPTTAPGLSQAAPAPMPMPAPVAVPAAPISAPTPMAAPAPMAVAPSPSPAPAPVPVRKADPAAAWAKAVARFAQERPLEAPSIGTTRFVDLRGDTLEISLPSNLRHKIAAFIAPRNLPLLEETLHAELGQAYKIAFLASDAPVAQMPDAATAAAAAPEPAKLDPKDFANDPQIRKAMELFQARIVSPAK